jgi:energy-coupling factor transporter transmembrane protein EcfT
MSSSLYTPRGSWIETFDARAQLIVYLCFTSSVLLVSDWHVLLALCFISAAIALLARLSWSQTRIGWLWLLLFTAVFTAPDLVGGHLAGAARTAQKLLGIFLATITVVRVINPDTFGVASRGLLAIIWIIPAAISLSARIIWRKMPLVPLWLLVLSVVFTWLNLRLGYDVKYAVQNGLALLALVVLGIVVLRTIDRRILSEAWRGPRVLDLLAFTTSLMMRYVPTFIADFEATRNAQMARGLELDRRKGKFIQRVRRLAPLIIPVMVRPVVEEPDVTSAMKLRAFGSVNRRTWLRQLHFRLRDGIAVASGIGLLGACMVLRRFGH